jgi:hypothetical protein
MTLIPTRRQWKKWSLPSRATYVGLLLALVGILLWLVSYYRPRSPDTVSQQKPSFSVAAEVLLTVPNREIISSTSPYLVAYSHGEETVLSPITDLIYIRFTNNRTAPLMIDYYAAEVRSTKEPQWKKAECLNRIGGLAGSKLFFTNPKDKFAGAFDTTLTEPLFDQAIKDRSIGAGEAVRGWLLIERPEGFDGEPNTRKWRFRIRDVNNNEGVSEIAGTIGKSLKESQTAVEFKLGDKRDISHLRLMYYSDIWK